jgi:hypothetical protein
MGREEMVSTSNGTIGSDNFILAIRQHCKGAANFRAEIIITLIYLKSRTCGQLSLNITLKTLESCCQETASGHDDSADIL